MQYDDVRLGSKHFAIFSSLTVGDEHSFDQSERSSSVLRATPRHRPTTTRSQRLCQLTTRSRSAMMHDCAMIGHLTESEPDLSAGNIHVAKCHSHRRWLRTLQSHTHLFNDSLSVTTQVSRYQKVKTNLDFTEARDSEWQWHQLGHMQVCISLQTDNHASTPPLCFFYRPDAFPAPQPTASKYWRQVWLLCTPVIISSKFVIIITDATACLAALYI